MFCFDCFLFTDFFTPITYSTINMSYVPVFIAFFLLISLHQLLKAPLVCLMFCFDCFFSPISSHQLLTAPLVCLMFCFYCFIFTDFFTPITICTISLSYVLFLIAFFSLISLHQLLTAPLVCLMFCFDCFFSLISSHQLLTAPLACLMFCFYCFLFTDFITPITYSTISVSYVLF